MAVTMVIDYHSAPKKIDWPQRCIEAIDQFLLLKQSWVLNKMGFKQPHMGKCNSNMIFERELNNIRLLRPYQPQTASKLGVKFQIRVG